TARHPAPDSRQPVAPGLSLPRPLFEDLFGKKYNCPPCCSGDKVTKKQCPGTQEGRQPLRLPGPPGLVLRLPCQAYCRCRSNIPVTVRYAHQAHERHLQSIFTWASVPGCTASSGSSIATDTRYCCACGTFTPGRCVGFVATVPPALDVNA